MCSSVHSNRTWPQLWRMSLAASRCHLERYKECKTLLINMPFFFFTFPFRSVKELTGKGKHLVPFCIWKDTWKHSMDRYRSSSRWSERGEQWVNGGWQVLRFVQNQLQCEIHIWQILQVDKMSSSYNISAVSLLPQLTECDMWQPTLIKYGERPFFGTDNRNPTTPNMWTILLIWN